MTPTTNEDNSRVRKVVVAEDEAGQRIDNFLARQLRGVPRSFIYRILRRGEVRVNSGRVSAQYRLQPGDTVRIPPARQSQGNTSQVPPRSGLNLDQYILAETERYLVLNKPSGMAVHGGSGLSYGIIESLRAARPDAPYLELAHRLDRETSGCLLLAKRRSFLRFFQQHLREGRVIKRYLALLAGHWRGGAETVDVALRKYQLQGGERRVQVDSGAGKAAITVFRTVEAFPQATLVEAELHTGRTHQIRVHAAHLGYPLAGDEKYGNREANRRFRALGLRRMFLHAHWLEFEDPVSHERVAVNSPLPAELRNVLDRLEE